MVAYGWKKVPEWVFCSRVGTALNENNFHRVWDRLRRRAQAFGVRPLKLHCARHTWATLALHAGKSVRWVADQLGHADPALTLRVYAHAMPQQETDLSFAEFGSTDLNGGVETDANPIPSRYQDDVTLRKASRNTLDLDEESWHAGRDSNPRPPGSKPGALSS